MRLLLGFLKNSFAPALFALALLGAPAAGPAAEGKPDCCRHSETEIARSLKNADRSYAQFKPREALAELQKILQADPNHFEALIKSARAHIDVGDQITEQGADWKERKFKEYTIAEGFARKAVQVDANSTWGHFWVAAAVGNIAMVSPITKQLDLAGEIRDEVEKAIALDRKNGSAYHIYGVWHRKVAEIGAASRMFASALYGRSVPSGSLEKSIEYLQKAVELNPTVIVSRLELAQSYIAVQAWAPARAMLRSIPDLPNQFSDDAKHKEKAAQLLAEIKEN
jgi:Tfp pilus assembly protein PilF